MDRMDRMDRMDEDACRSRRIVRVALSEFAPCGRSRSSRRNSLRGPMITGIHAMLYSNDADATRSFFRDVLGLASVDAGGGWLIFALPPAELGIHPAEGSQGSGLYLMCDDVERTVLELRRK